MESHTSTPTRPQINFTRGYASWEKGKTYIVGGKKIDWVLIIAEAFQWVFISHCAQSIRFCSKRTFFF
jgi:hypothetical protein